MTIDEIKQALREMKERCANIQTCKECPFAVNRFCFASFTTIKTDIDGFAFETEAAYPRKWIIDWPEDDTIDKANATDPLTMNDYQHIARRTAERTMANCKKEGNHESFVDVGEPCNREKKDMNKGREIGYGRMADAAYAAIMAIKLATHVLGCSIDDISKMDMGKISPRYTDGFDHERSRNREGDRYEN